MGELEGKVALIVGAGPGIGRACAEVLGAEGSNLALVARRPEPLTQLREALAARGGSRVIALPGDLARVADCTRVVDQTVEQLGRIDIVVNVATLASGSAAVLDADWEAWRKAFDVNVVGTLEVSRRAAEHMKAQGEGSIVQIATLGMHSLVAKRAAYNATKQAMVTASKTMAREIGRHGVRLNIVTPGFTTGEPLDQLWSEIARSTGRTAEDISQAAAGSAAMKRHVDPEDIAAAVYYFASPRSRNVTGEEIIVDAGQHIGG